MFREIYRGPLPTIAHDQAHGVTSFTVHCEGLYCGHWGDVTIERLALPDSVPVVDIGDL
ncbi:MAG: hypothetical protein ABSC72_12705 [Methylovirgula sp.]|jgi:hypothetical protein